MFFRQDIELKNEGTRRLSKITAFAAVKDWTVEMSRITDGNGPTKV